MAALEASELAKFGLVDPQPIPNPDDTTYKITPAPGTEAIIQHRRRAFLCRAIGNLCDWVCLRWAMSDVDGANERWSIWAHGSGTTGGLRECRHTWFGEDSDGYVFYLNRSDMEFLLDNLARFFDLD
ncbi:MAG TPA: hypothetical protein VFJ24_11865 [Gaiellales bacterium]|nr:hypothetical protein [Gaiellales bacterium]